MPWNSALAIYSPCQSLIALSEFFFHIIRKLLLYISCQNMTSSTLSDAFLLTFVFMSKLTLNKCSTFVQSNYNYGEGGATSKAIRGHGSLSLCSTYTRRQQPFLDTCSASSSWHRPVSLLPWCLEHLVISVLVSAGVMRKEMLRTWCCRQQLGS